MPHVTIEHVILLPLLFSQILVFPFAASLMASNWANAQREAELQDAANHLASTIQQLYLSVNRKEISVGNITQALTLPQTINSYPYTATMDDLSGIFDSSKVLTISLRLDNVGNTVTASALLGPNALCVEGSSFKSISPDASIKVQKFADVNGTLWLRFSFVGG